jgi:hypothetical protein
LLKQGNFSLDTGEQTILQAIMITLFFGIISLVISWIAWSKGFYSLTSKKYKPPAITFSYLIVSFLIFITVYAIFAQYILSHLMIFLSHYLSQRNIMTILQLIVFLITASLISIHGWYTNQTVFKKIWKDSTFPERKPISYDIKIGLLSWIIAFPWVIVASEIAEAITLFIYGRTGNEQAAIQYLKLAMGSPFSLSVALLTILIGAPLLEEYLFRGVLQTWLRRKLSPISAIIISSLSFAAFHLTPGQGIGNITLFFSLFAFAIYLGFIYEKQRSLFSNVFLHVTFNLISVIRILTY